MGAVRAFRFQSRFVDLYGPAQRRFDYRLLADCGCGDLADHFAHDHERNVEITGTQRGEGYARSVIFRENAACDLHTAFFILFIFKIFNFIFKRVLTQSGIGSIIKAEPEVL